jgi:DNA repair exonuclease SbcCD ATPase subunit
LGALENRLAELTRSADAIPDHARRDHSVVLREIEDAKKNERDKNAAVHRADADYRMLVERRKQRTAVAEKLDATNRAFGRAKLLAELVGRDRLQRHLLRRAERQIVEYANGVLDRLSGGQMMLRLVGGDEGAADEKALSLEVVNRATGGKAIGVEFLSGSQRFRVAVSLALGIGQYASRRHRPIESVIIDEGFGCLDRNGRQVMVQELQNLRGQLNCILLVSHQEEFADAFANGYHFEIANDTTKVTRVQR